MCVVACSSKYGSGVGTEATVAESTILQSGIDIEYIDSSVRPGDNFYGYVNGKWIEQNPVPEDRSDYDAFDVLGDAAQEDVRRIIEDAAKTSRPVGSDE